MTFWDDINPFNIFTSKGKQALTKPQKTVIKAGGLMVDSVLKPPVLQNSLDQGIMKGESVFTHKSTNIGGGRTKNEHKADDNPFGSKQGVNRPLKDHADKPKNIEDQGPPIPPSVKAEQDRKIKAIKSEILKYVSTPTDPNGRSIPKFVYYKDFEDYLNKQKQTHDKVQKETLQLEREYKNSNSFIQNMMNPAMNYEKKLSERKPYNSYDEKNYKQLVSKTSVNIYEWTELKLHMQKHIKIMKKLQQQFYDKEKLIKQYLKIQKSFNRGVKTSHEDLRKMSNKDILLFTNKIISERNMYDAKQEMIKEFLEFQSSFTRQKGKKNLTKSQLEKMSQDEIKKKRKELSDERKAVKEEEDRIVEEKKKKELSEKKKKLKKELVDDIREQQEYPPLSEWYKDFYTDDKSNLTTKEGSKAKWIAFAKKKKKPVKDIIKKYKRNLLAVVLEETMMKNLKKDRSGEFKDAERNILTDKAKKLVKRVRKKDNSNMNWFNLLFPTLERKQFDTKFQDTNKKVKDPKKKDGFDEISKNDADNVFWFQDPKFYISPEKLVPSRYYITDAIMANLVYMPPTKRPKLVKSIAYRKDLLLDKNIPKAIYKDDVAVYSSNTITYICFKGTTMNKVMDWADNLINAIGEYRNSDKYESHKQIIEDTQKKYPDSRIRLVGHSRGGFYASTLAKDFKLKGASFTGATTTLINKFTKNVKGFNFYVSDKFDVVSVLRKTDKKNDVHIVANIEGINSHAMLNYVPRMYWTEKDQKKYDSVIQKEYIKYLKGKKNKTPTEQKILSTAVETAKRIGKTVAIGSFLAFITGGGALAVSGYSVGYDTIMKSGILYREVWNEKYNDDNGD